MASLTVGIDLGVDSAKVICLKPMKNSYQLKAHALLGKGQLGGLKEFLNHSSIKQADVRIAIQVPHLKVQQVTVPIVPKEELPQVISWAFKEATNLSMDDYLVRYYQIGEDGETKQQVFTAFAIEKPFFDKWAEFISNAGIVKPKMAEPDIQSLANLVVYNHGFAKGYRFVIIDIGKSQTQLAVVSDLGIEFFKPFSNISSDALASDAALELGISKEEAERRIVDISNNVNVEKQSELEEVINGFCAKFCVQAQYAIENYSSKTKQSPITNIYLAGGGASLKGLREQIQDTLHFPTDLVNPFVRLDLGQFREGDFANSQTLYAVATGLAL